MPPCHPRVAVLHAVLALCLTAAPTPVQAGFDIKALQTLWVLPKPTPPKDALNRDLVRVRIYPHTLKNPEKRAAESLTSVTLTGSCQLSLGLPNAVGSSGKPIGKLKPGKSARFHFTLAKVKKPLWLTCTGPVQVERKSPLTSHTYEASFYIHTATSTDIAAGPFIQIVAVLPIDTYLRGVVPTEVSPSWPTDTLKAQAIAARSYVYFNMAHNQYFPNPKIYDIDDSNHYQAFSGLTNVHDLTDAALAATQGQILTHAGQVFPTFFDSDAGGHTESAATAFNLPAPYCIAEPEPSVVVDAVKTWTVTANLTDIAKALPTKLTGGRPLSALNLADADISAGKRALRLQAKFQDGTSAAVPIADIRRAVPDLKSAMFKVTEPSPGQVRFDGQGTGHGVGLNQTGAKILAENGWSYQKILDFYFKSARLCSLSSSTAGLPSC